MKVLGLALGPEALWYYGGSWLYAGGTSYPQFIINRINMKKGSIYEQNPWIG